MSDDLIAGPFHNHRRRAVTVHLGSALLVGGLLLSTSAVSPARRASSRTRDLNQRSHVEGRALAR